MPAATSSQWSLARLLEDNIAHALSRIPKNQWEENHITFEWLRAVAPILDGASVGRYADRRTVRCEIFKLRGKIEQNHGDIAVIVCINYPDGDSLEGVGFIEAKKRDWNKDTFPGMRADQLRRLYRNAHYPKIVIYDREPCVPGFSCPAGHDLVHTAYLLDREDDVVLLPALHRAHAYSSTTHSVVIAMETLLPAHRRGRRVFQFGQPLSSQLALRYLVGEDLDQRDVSVAAARAAANEEQASTYVLSLGVSVGVAPAPVVEPPNHDRYERIPVARRE